MERHHQQTDPGLPANFDATMAWSATITKRTCQAYRKGSSSSKVAAIVSGGRHNETAATRLRGPARLSLLSVSNQRCYAARHGYTYHRLTHNFLHASECIACREAAERAGRKKAQGKKPLNGMWNKQFHLKYALDAAPMGTWVLWVDGDVLFTNPDMRVENILRRARRDTARHPAAAESEDGLEKPRWPQQPESSGSTHQCDVVLQSHLNAGVIALRKTCWAMRFLDYWIAHRDWCAYPPLRDNGPMILALAAAMRGQIREEMSSPPYVPVTPRFDADPRGVCTESFNLSGLAYTGSRVCVTRGGFENRTSESTHDGRGFNSPWQPGDLLAHFLGSVYGEVRSCFGRFVGVAAALDKSCACAPSALPCGNSALQGLVNCHPQATWRSWAPPHARFAKGYSAY